MKDIKFWKIFIKNVGLAIGIIVIVIIVTFVVGLTAMLFEYNDMYGFILLGVIAIIGLIVAKSIQDYNKHKHS